MATDLPSPWLPLTVGLVLAICPAASANAQNCPKAQADDANWVQVEPTALVKKIRLPSKPDSLTHSNHPVIVDSWWLHAADDTGRKVIAVALGPADMGPAQPGECRAKLGGHEWRIVLQRGMEPNTDSVWMAVARLNKDFSAIVMAYPTAEWPTATLLTVLANLQAQSLKE